MTLDTAFQSTHRSRRNGGVTAISPNEIKRKQEEREAQRKATEEKFQRLKEGDTGTEWPSTE